MTQQQQVLIMRTAALNLANHHRRERAELKRRIAQGRVHPAAIVMWPPRFAITMPAASVIACARWMGQHRSEAVLRRCDVREDAQLRELSDRDRVRIVKTLRAQHPRLFEAWGTVNPEKEASA